MIEFPSALISTRHNPMAGLDLETTGLIAGYHEIIQIACVVADDEIEPTDKYFYMHVRPEHIDRIDEGAAGIHGIDLAELSNWPTADIVLDMFNEWFEGLNLPLNKKLTPVVQNWSFESKFLEAWMGSSEMSQKFSLPRDPLRVAAWMNDRACFRCDPLPFPEDCRLNSLCDRLGVELDNHHNALADAIAGLRVYKELMRKG